jgi:hypothetical protein
MPQAAAQQPATSPPLISPPHAAASALARVADPPPAKRRGNPNLGLAPRCGARTRAGCPCRAPAIRGKLRCRMHGGHSTGPRTQEGRARVAAARTIHGRYSAEWRARNRHIQTFLRRNRVYLAAARYRDRLLPEFAARFEQSPPELRLPPYTTGGITAAQDRAMQRAEAAALAPWKQAIALARIASRGPVAVPAADGAQPAAAEVHAPVQGAAARLAGEGRSEAPAKAHAPEAAGPAAQHGTDGLLRAMAEAQAPEPSCRATPSADLSAALRVAKPHAPEQTCRSSDTADFARAVRAARPHAPEAMPSSASRSARPPGSSSFRQSLLAGTAVPGLHRAAAAFTTGARQ